MKFSCTTAGLIEALATATKALPARTTNPILEGIKLTADAEERRITLTCTDERITIITSIDADVELGGEGVLPGRLFNEIIRRMQDERVSIAKNSGNSMIYTIKCGPSTTKIMSRDPSLFPKLPELQNERKVSLPQDMLRDMIQKTEFAIAVNDMREVLNGSLLEIGGGKVTMVSLDGFRLALKSALCSELIERFEAIIPGRALSEIGKLLRTDEDAFVSLSFAVNKLHIALDETDIYVQLLEGKYVQYDQIIPKSFDTTLRLSLESFKRCIDRAALIAREGNNNLIQLRIADNVMVIEAHSQIGDVHEELSVDQMGKDINIAFNAKYLTDVVRYIDADEIEVNMNTPVSPCIVTPADDKSYMHLILPVRTGTR